MNSHEIPSSLASPSGSTSIDPEIPAPGFSFKRLRRLNENIGKPDQEIWEMAA
jgi:hypothetical protein